MKHYRVHSNQSMIPCGVSGCNKHFRKLSAFYSHLSRDHRLLQNRKTASFVQTLGVKVKCQVTSCQRIVSFSDLVKHLKGHIDAGIRIKCPAAGCGREMAKKSTFSAHISIKHGTFNKLNVNKQMFVSEAACPAASNDCEQGESSSVTDEQQEVLKFEEQGSVACLEDTDPSEFVHNLALFFLKLQCRYFVPNSTVSAIAEEMLSLYEISFDNILKFVQSRLLLENVPSEKN